MSGVLATEWGRALPRLGPWGWASVRMAACVLGIACCALSEFDTL